MSNIFAVVDANFPATTSVLCKPYAPTPPPSLDAWRDENGNLWIDENTIEWRTQ